MSGREEEPHARNLGLEAGILEAPESPDAYLVYGDWLLEQGDPLGELVTVQATLAKLRTRAGKAKEKSALERREKILRKDAEARLGHLKGYEHTWSLGFLESLALPNPTPKEYEAVLAAPAARFLRELDIEDVPFISPLRGTHPTIALLTRLGFPPALRKLALMCDRAMSELGPIPPELWSSLASLRELTIRCGRFYPGAIVLPKLESLALTAPLTDALLDSLRKAECPLLMSVQLEAEQGEVDATAVSARRLGPLFEKWSEAGTLRHLGVTEHGAGDELLDSLLTTGLVKQLTSLDLSRAGLSDQGGKDILSNAPSFDHLESLNLSENDLSDSTTRALEKRFELVVDVEEQGTRYDSIQE